MMHLLQGILLAGILLALVSSDSSSSPITYELLAEFVTVDYLWNINHTQAVYEETGHFVVCNNIITGIKVSKSNEIFVTVPRWYSGVPSSLNKLVPNPNGPGYVLNPWPSWEFNAVNGTEPGTYCNNCLQYAQSMLIDSNNLMWIPDVGRINFADPNPAVQSTTGAPMMYVVNVTDGRLMNDYTYIFPDNVLPYNSTFLNDLVIDETSGFVYLTNTAGDGGIVVYNYNARVSKMFQGPSTQNNYSYEVIVNGINYGTNSRVSGPSDGIALSSDLSTLYWCPVQGVGLWSIKTSFLKNFLNTNAQFNQNVVLLGYKNGISDGIQFLNNYLLYGDITNSGIYLLENAGQYVTANSIQPSFALEIPTSPQTLNWLDTFSIDFNDPNSFYFTTNRLNLFFTGTMDFTGQSGSNFRIYHGTVYLSSDSSGDKTDNKKLNNWEIILVALSAVLAAFFIYFFRQKFVNKDAGSSLSDVFGADDHKGMPLAGQKL